jgi:hypothetical protein
MIDQYGPFAEDCNALECERLYNIAFCASTGPDIALALPTIWQHSESVELSGLVPVA